MAVSSDLRIKNKPVVKAGTKMTPEIYFARKLASNEKKIRDRSLKKLRRWIEARSSIPDAFSEEELFKLWKGLFYCMWMSDKPLIQEDLAETISSLVFSVTDRRLALKFVTVALKTMARDWSGIDTWRMDKFLMFIRRIIRKSLEYLAEGGWKEEEVAIYSQMISDCIMNANKNTATLQVPVGLQLHITNLFPEELAKAGGEDLSSDAVLKMLEPFAKCLAFSQDFRLKKDVRQYVFTYLIKQSDAGIAYDEEDAAHSSRLRREANNPTKKRKSTPKNKEEPPKEDNDESSNEEEEEPAEEVEEEPAEEDEEEAEEEMEGDDEDIDDADEEPDEDMAEIEESNPDWGAKDPRAGGVDVVLPQLNLDYNKLADMLFKLASDKSVRSKNRKAMYHLVQWFRDLSKGVYPLAVELPVVGDGLTPRAMKKAALQFIQDELKMTEERNAEKLLVRKSRKAQRKLEAEAEILDKQKGEENEGSDEEDLNGSEAEDEEDDGEELEEEGSEDELDEEDDDEELDEEEEDDEEDEENLDEEEEDSASEEEVKLPVKATKGNNKKPLSKSAQALATFEVEDDWEDDEAAPSLPAAMKQLKRKLKADKRPLKSDTKESLSGGEIEIVIPNKKYKGSEKMTAPATTPEKSGKNQANEGNRRVNFVLAKNTAQEPRDYQESLRKSPGVPHDPERQPNGGVLKRRTNAQHQQASKLAGPSKKSKKGLSPRVLL